MDQECTANSIQVSSTNQLQVDQFSVVWKKVKLVLEKMPPPHLTTGGLHNAPLKCLFHMFHKIGNMEDNKSKIGITRKIMNVKKTWKMTI